MLINAFNKPLYVENCIDLPQFRCIEQTFKSQLEYYISQPYIQDYKVPQARGEAYTTVHRPFALNALTGFKELCRNLYPYFTAAKDAILSYPNQRDLGDLKISRSWANYMHIGCAGIAHTHDSQGIDLIGIFYLEAPPNSSKLVIIDSTESQNTGKLETYYAEEKKLYIEPRPYSLVVHTNDTIHAVSEHMSNDRRVAIIFEMSVDFRG